MQQAHNYTSFNDAVRPDTLSDEYPELFTRTQINWLIRNRKFNGLNDCGAVLKVGGKLYVSREKFFDWFYAQQE